MQYAIELYYDEDSEKKLFNIVQRVADEKLSTKNYDTTGWAWYCPNDWVPPISEVSSDDEYS